MSLILGGVAFQSMEIPPEVNFSGGHMLGKHTLIGGGRVIDAMGDDPAPMEWSGFFLGTNAAGRARAIDAMKQSGQQVELIVGSLAYQVVIADFRPRYQRDYQIPYTIRVEVVSDAGGGGFVPSLGDLIAGDFGALAGFSLDAGTTAAIATAQTSISAAAATASTGLIGDATYGSLQSAIGSSYAAAGAVQAAQATSDAAMTPASLDAVPGLAPAEIAANVLAQTDAAATLSDTTTAVGYMGRINGNLSLYGG